MEEEQRLETYTTFAENSRKWIAVMDAKAAFLSALNGVLVAFLWSGLKLSEIPIAWLARGCGIAASVVAFAALMAALWIVVPREQVKVLFGGEAAWSSEYRPFSYYGFVAAKYRPADFAKLESDLAALDARGLAQVELEQHFTISHVVATKSRWVSRSGYLTMIAVLIAGITLLLKVYQI